MSATLDESPDRHVLTLLDHRVTQFVVEVGALRLLTWTLHDALELRVGGHRGRQRDEGRERGDDAASDHLMVSC